MSPIPGNNRQDPHNPDDEDISFAAMDMNIIMAGSSSDSAGEEDDNEYAGYQALPQEPGDDNDDDFTMESEGAMGGDHSDTTDHSIPEEELGNKHIPSYLQMPDAQDVEVEERKSLWSESRLHPQEPMDADHLNKIKSAMSGFHLTGCQMPEWARVVTEDDWKSQLLSRLQKTLIHPAPSGQDNPEPSDPPSKRPKCGLEETDEEEKPDRENPLSDNVTQNEMDKDTEDR